MGWVVGWDGCCQRGSLGWHTWAGLGWDAMLSDPGSGAVTAAGCYRCKTDSWVFDHLGLCRGSFGTLREVTCGPIDVPGC